VRFGWELDPTDVDAAPALEAQGYDLVLLTATQRSATAAAAAIGAVTTGLRVVVAEEVGAEHPVELAEEIAVADLMLGGRAVLAVRPAAAHADRFADVLDLLSDALATHPFRHEGEVWSVPANLPENRFNLEKLVRVMPAPAQFDLPIWVAGPVGRSEALERGFGVLVDPDEGIAGLGAWWADAAAAAPGRVRRMRRVLVWEPPIVAGRIDVAAAIDDLVRRRAAIALDVVIVRPAAGVDVDTLAADIASEVRPRVQLDRLPPGLDDHWTAHRAATTGIGAPDISEPDTSEPDTSKGDQHG
jgi:alkanesulfonate monooxygenase SsuD/methylene tetrahydromethanopterin reductase-like flavin-dependent oxidoreductase (luciferase family)